MRSAVHAATTYSQLPGRSPLMWGGGGKEAQANMEETAVSGSSRQLTLKKGAPGDQV